MIKYSEKTIAQRLANLDLASVGSFACAAAARQLSNFERHTDFKNPLPRKILVDLHLPMRGLLNEDRWRHAHDEVSKLISDDDNAHWVSCALAAHFTASLAYAIEVFIKDPTSAIYAARRSYEAADQAAIHLLGGLEMGMEDRILGHPIVQRELQRQERDLQMLEDGQWDAFEESYLKETLLSDYEWLELLLKRRRRK